MNILLINQYAGNPQLGMEFRPYYIAQSAMDIGHDIFILAADYSHLRKKNPGIGYEVIDNINYLWLKSCPYNGNGLKRVLNIFSFLFSALKSADDILTWSKPEVIVASSTHPLDNYIAHYLAKKCGAKVIYEVHDLWPLSPMEIGNISKWHPFIILLQFAEDYGYRNADQVISMLPNTLEHMLKHGLKQDKFNYIPNGILYPAPHCDDAFLPLKHKELLSSLKADNKFIVGYAGGHAKSNALDKLIHSAMYLPQIEFVLVGDGSEKYNLQHQARGLSNVHFLPQINKNTVPEFLSYCDVLTLVWNDSELYRFGVSPNKVFDYMLAKKPIIQALRSMHEPVRFANAGITVDSENVLDLVQAFEDISLMSSYERDILGENGYKYVIDNHCYSKLTKIFIDVCEKC